MNHFGNACIFSFIFLTALLCTLITGDIGQVSLTGVFGDEDRSSLTPAGRIACTEGDGCLLESTEKLNFFIVGDIGGLPIYPYYSYAQNQVANMMAVVATKDSPAFVLNVGDNFYWNGAKNIFDSRFENSFENIYDKSELSVPWYMIAGNHDHLGNITAQIAYTDFSSKWTFPNLFYKIRYIFGMEGGKRTTVDILMIDTIVLCGNTVDIQGDKIWDWLLFSKKLNPTGPPEKYVELAKIQWNWIRKTLRESTADYLFVTGHYPIYSTCEHGNFECLQKLDHLLRKYNANAYFSGHDHNLQHIQVKTRHDDEDQTMDYIVCGAASRTDKSAKHINDLPEGGTLMFRDPEGSNWFKLSQLGFSHGGFIKVNLDERKAVFTFYTGKGEAKYQMRINPRKQVFSTEPEPDYY